MKKQPIQSPTENLYTTRERLIRQRKFLQGLGGAVDRNDQQNVGNPAYKAPLQNLDGDMPQYIFDNTDDEISHAAFLTAYLKSEGVNAVDLRLRPGATAKSRSIARCVIASRGRLQ